MKTTPQSPILAKFRQVFLLSLALQQILGAAAHAQTAFETRDRLTGYHPSVISSEAEVNDLFNGLNTRFKRVQPFQLRFGTECTQRAETWSYDLATSHNLKLEKVFIFYTHAYHEFYRQKFGETFDWWFHVAPFVRVKTSSGEIDERVLDRSFSETPLNMKDWTDLFVESKKPCLENIPFSEFSGDVTAEGPSHDPTAHCYIIRTPMYDLLPIHADARQKGSKTSLEWDLDEVRWGTKALTASARRSYWSRLER